MSPFVGLLTALVLLAWTVGAVLGLAGLIVSYIRNAPSRRIQRGLPPKKGNPNNDND